MQSVFSFGASHGVERALALSDIVNCLSYGTNATPLTRPGSGIGCLLRDHCASFQKDRLTRSPNAVKHSKQKWAIIAFVFVLGVTIILAVFHSQKKKPQSAATKTSPGMPSASGPSMAAAAPSPTAPVNPPIAGAAQQYPNFQLRPLAVARESANFQWTAEDGRLPEVIDKLAHNELEEERMLKENPRIKRRQLVYIKQTAAALVEQAKLTGEKVQRLVLPGLDGQELQFEITHADLEPSGQIGTFTGHLAGRPQSSVSLAYRFGRQAFTILSPEDGNNLDAEPREPGQVIVKSIDPDAYSPVPGGEPILTKPIPRKVTNP